MPKPGLIACVVRNGLHHTKRAVPTFRANDREILIIDNGSTDGTSEWLMTQPDIHSVSLHSQESLSWCWNFACRYAFNGCGHQNILLVNNDVEIRPDTYDELTYYSIHHSAVGMTTCVSVGSREELRLNDKPISSSPHPDFSCFLLQKWAYEKVGTFDETLYPAYTEDSDWHVRAHRSGVLCVSIDLPFVHYGAGTLAQADPKEAYAIRSGADRNREKFRQKYGCLPGTPEYDTLFTDESFGIDSVADVSQSKQHR